VELEPVEPCYTYDDVPVIFIDFFLLAFWCGSVRSQEVVAKARRVLFLYFEPDWLPP